MEYFKVKVQNYLASKTTIKADEYDNALLVKEVGIDSLQLIELIIWVEKETGQPIEMEDLLQNDDISINSISSYLEKYSAKT